MFVPMLALSFYLWNRLESAANESVGLSPLPEW